MMKITAWGGKILHDELQKDRRPHTGAQYPPRIPAPGKIHRRIVIHAAADMAGQQQGRGSADQERGRPVRDQQHGGGRETESADDEQRRLSGSLRFADLAEQGKGKKTRSRTGKPEHIYGIYGIAPEDDGAALIDKRLGQHEGEKAQRKAESAKKF